MTLSKKNIDKLKSFSTNDLSNQKIKPSFNANNANLDNPNDIFYSIIDNSSNINETILQNQRLKKSEENFFNSNNDNHNSIKNIRDKSNSTKLSEEELLYDEFNYLLDE